LRDPTKLSSLIPACPSVPASSKQPVYSFPQSRQQGKPHLESHRPVVVISRSSPSAVSITAYLVKVEHQIQLTHVPEERIQYLHKEVYRLKVCELVVVCINACAEEETSVSAINNLGHVAKFDKVGLVLLIAGRDEAVDLCAWSARGRSWTWVCGRKEYADGVRVIIKTWQEEGAYLALELHLLLILCHVSVLLKISFN
jgi:hypothetical protein